MKKVESKLYVVFFWFLLIFFLVLFSFVLKKAINITGSKLNKVYKVNFVVVGLENKLYLFSFTENQYLIIKNIQDIKIKFDSKDVPIKEKIDFSNKNNIYLSDTIQNFLQVPVLGYIIDDSFTDNSSLKKSTMKLLQRSIKKINKSNFINKDLEYLLYKTIFTSNRKFKIENQEIYNTDLFKDTKIKNEFFSVEILNATEHDGLAQRLSVMLNNVGFRTIRISDYLGKSGVSKIIYSDESRNSFSVNTLKLIIGCDFEKSKDSNRADISIILGEDYWKKMLTK